MILIAALSALPTFLTVTPLSESDAEGIAADAAAFVRDTPADAVAWCCTLVPEGDPAVDKASVLAGRIRRHAAAFGKVSDAPWGVLFQATVGHGWTPMSRTPWQKVICANGSERYKFCPLGKDILAYVAAQAKTLAATGPAFFMVDDDTRLITSYGGCYCPLHLAEFGRRTGRTWTRETLLAAKEADESLARQYDELLKDSFVPFMRAIRAAFPPETPGYFCCCNQDAHHAYVLAKTLAAPGQRPVIRINNAIYVCGNDPQQMPRVLSQTARQIADIRGEATILCENDPCPQNRNALGSVPLANQLVMSLLEGCDGAKIWPFRGHNTHERKSFEAYRACFASVRGAVDAVRAMKLRRTGVVIPLPRERPFSVWLSYDPQDWSTRYFARVGIPFRFGAPGTNDVVALTDADLDYFGDAELERLLAGRVLLDGSAAIGLAKRGFGPLIGVEAKPWAGKPISQELYGDGVRLNGGMSASADLTARAAEAAARSRLFHRASPLSPECEEQGPGSILFRNRLGGRVFTIAASLPPTRPNLTQWHYFSETRKRAVLAALAELGGAPEAYYPDDAETIFETGVAADGSSVFLFDNLGIDTLENPEVVLAAAPIGIERLTGDGRWVPVAFNALGEGRCRLNGTKVETLRPAIFRWRSAK